MPANVRDRSSGTRLLPRGATTLVAVASVWLATTSARAQGVGMMGMSGMSRDSATMAQMRVIHELTMHHEKIVRTVTNLPDGIRTSTTSADPEIARLIKLHVLELHAAEVSDLVQGGMDAMHAAMMKNMGAGMSMGPGMHMASGMSMGAGGGMSAGMSKGGDVDSGFTAMQARGMEAMGVDQYTSTHHFDALPDGGRIELRRDVDDTAGVEQIRRHLQAIATSFADGDFTTPAFVHMQEVPGAAAMAARRAMISYTYQALPLGGEVRIVTKDPEALAAIHEFLAFQRRDHHAP